ncbi:hypothetical protein EVAR_61797_1 [Eumeta japonica]|uniref:Odorant receptor n=1 Tax=Eumeta variegata TaxID=151549 RepID=A0A4C1YYB3_EUMVA|nr:hypothetical protein EVAR_61797_1 [Eumeta japonica]
MMNLKQNTGLFGPSLRIMDITGIGLQRKNVGYKVFMSMTIAVTVYVFTALYELWLLRGKLEEALHNASITIVGVMVSLKCASLIYRQERWRQLISGLSRLEFNILCENDVTSKAIIGDYIKYLRMLGYVYAILVFGTNATFISQPLLKFASAEYRSRLSNGTATYQNIFSSWYPFDKTKPPGYWVSVVVEVFVNLYGGLIITVFDVNVVAVMVFMKGHIQILKHKCQSIFGNLDGIVTEREAEARIKECSIYHTSLLK